MTLAGNFGDPKTERDIRSAKRTNFIALALLLVLGTVMLYLIVRLAQQHQALEEKTQQLSDSTANLQRIRGELEAAQSLLVDRERQIQEQLIQLSRNVEDGNYADARAQATAITTRYESPSSSAPSIMVHLYAYQPLDQALDAIRKYLSQPGFELVKEETLTSLPAWMGSRSAVFFYSKGSAATAAQVAQALSRATGVTFSPQAGNPDDVPADRQSEWLRIQYLGKELPAQQ